jgi:hypothetical protein
MKILLLFVALIVIPCHIKAQNQTGESDKYAFRPGLLKKDLRALYQGRPQYYKVVLETDTLDSYLFEGTAYRINCFYKNDTCYKLQTIMPFDHRQIKNIAQNSDYKKIGKDTWLHSDGIVEIKIMFARSNDLAIMEGTLANKKPKE